MIRLAVVVALLAAACGTDTADVQAPPLVTTSTTAPTTTAAAPATAVPTTTVPPAVVEQVDCPDELRSSLVACGTAVVALDRDDGSAGTTTITLATIAGTEPDGPPPVAVLQGGPGGASTGFASWFPQQPFTQVFVDQRGTGFTGPDLDCPEYDDRLPELFGLPADQTVAGANEALAACAARIADDPTLQSADSVTHAADVAEVMAALGYDEWLVYGVSYGTTIGFELLRSEPEGLVGAVLDGVYPVDLDVDAGVAYSADRALDELAAACAADEECAGWAPDVVALVEELMVTLDRDPITVDTDDGSVLLDGGRLAEFVFVVLYSEQRMRFLPGALAGIAAGDDDAARWLARNGTASIVSSQGINDEGTYWAVQCHDRLPFTDGPPDDAAPFPAAIASALLADSCDPWDRPGATTADPVVSDLPTLLLSGRFDPITPSSYAADAAAHLGAPTLVEQDGRGHGIWPGGDDCITAIVAAFVADPDGEVDTGCAAAGVPVDWARP